MENNLELSIFPQNYMKSYEGVNGNKLIPWKSKKYDFDGGNSASGIDLPELEVDIKTTSINQPQSSCPFKSARQKIYGLGYNLLVFV